MHAFNDIAGRTWNVVVTVDTFKRVQALIGVDLRQVVGGDLLGRLIDDPILLCDVVYGVCKPQADEVGVTDEEFGRAMGGDALDGAYAALLEELSDFFPSRQRLALRKAVKTAETLMDAALTMAMRKLDQAASQSGGEPSTGSPASSESTPAP